MTWKPDICIHHFPCDDGFGAAWVVNRKWGTTVEYRGTNYGQAVPDAGIDGKHLLIADFSFKPEVLKTLAGRAASIIVLDHHKTAEADLDGFNKVVGGTCENVERLFAKVSGADMNILTEFRMDLSGAMLTWRFCFPDEKPPQLIRHIQDRDLWEMKLEQTRRISLLLRSYPYDFEIWSDLARALDDIGGDRGNLLAQATAIERFYDLKLAELVPAAVRLQTIDGSEVPALNVPWSFASDAADLLLKTYPDAPFAVAYFDNGGGRTYSLRSRDGRRDVSEVARKYGGGGHRNASGFRMPL